MGRLLNDFFVVYKGMGLRYAYNLILMPRVCYKLGIKKYSTSHVINSFIENHFKDEISKYKGLTLIKNVGAISQIIWVFWWQGQSSMPHVIKQCYKSVLRNANGRKVIFLDKTNYREYVKISSTIYDKFQNGIISFTHFSDIIRVELLKAYGGIWIDAAIYVTKPIPYSNQMFYSPRLSTELQDTPHLNQWVMGVMGASPNLPLFNYMHDMLNAYWTKFDVVFHYLMFDYFLRYGYEHFAWMKRLMDCRPVESPDLHSTRYTFGNEVDEEKLDLLLQNNTFLSLTYRIGYPLKTEKGKLTFYSALLKKTLTGNERINENGGGYFLNEYHNLEKPLRLRNFVDKIKKNLILLRYSYWQWRDKDMNTYVHELHIMSMDDTVDYIIKHKCSCARYGDGEFLVLAGQYNQFQKKDKVLAERLREIILRPVDGLLLCMPSFITNVRPFVLNSKLTGLGFNHSLLKSAVMPYVSAKNVYGDSLFTRFYMNQKNKRGVADYVKKLKKIWDKENLLIVEGKFSRLGVGNDLFDNASSVKRILCPQENAFDIYGKILDSVRRNHHEELIIIALGMTATVLAYDLTKDGKRALDLGHIDVEYEWFRMGAKEKVAIPYKQMSEVVDGKCNILIEDEEYNKQIIVDLS